jgi:hypothetical protein
MPAIALYGGATLVLEALNPTTGATVAGVTIDQATLYAAELDGAGGGDPDVFPVWLQPSA